MTRVLSILRRKAPRFVALFDDRKGATAITVAFALTGIAGMAGLATEASGWYLTSRTMQSAADAAAYSAATALAAGESKTDSANEAKYVAASTGYNFTGGTNSVSVTVNNPPVSGSHTSDNSAVEVIISQPETPLLSGLFLSSGPTIKARSVATAAINGGGCVLALDRGDVQDLGGSGSTNLNLNNCAVYVNSDDASGALTLSGNASITASGAYVTGGISGGAGLHTGGNTHTGVAPINDPYADVAVPTTTTKCPAPTTSGGGAIAGQVAGDVNLSTSAVLANPSGLCLLDGSHGLTLSGGSTTLSLAAGVYVIDGTNGGTLNLSGGSSLSGTGVTIVLTGSGTHYATATISGGSTVSLTAPTTGTTAGLAFFQDRNAPSSGTDTLSGGSTQNITGAIYFPHQPINFSGGSGTSAPACTQLIAFTITFSGSSTFKNNCAGIGTTAFGNASATMVE